MTVAVAAVAVAVVLGFLAGAALESAPVLERLPPPAATPPTPLIVLSRSLVLPAANVSPSYAASSVNYWTTSDYAGGNFTYTWSAPFAVDACMADWVTSNPFAVPLDNLTDCASANASVAWTNATRGSGSFTVPDQDAWFALYVLSPSGLAGTVDGSYTIVKGGATLVHVAFSQTVPAGQLSPPYVYVSVTVALPPGYDAVTVQGDASSPVRVTFNLNPLVTGNAFAQTAWNVTAYYPSPPALNVTFQALAPVPTNVTLAAAVFET